MILKNCQIVPQPLSQMSKTGLGIPLEVQHPKLQTVLSPYAHTFIKATEPHLLILHINDCETAIFQISGPEKKGQVTN